MEKFYLKSDQEIYLSVSYPQSDYPPPPRMDFPKKLIITIGNVSWQVPLEFVKSLLQLKSEDDLFRFQIIEDLVQPKPVQLSEQLLDMDVTPKDNGGFRMRQRK